MAQLDRVWKQQKLSLKNKLQLYNLYFTIIVLSGFFLPVRDLDREKGEQWWNSSLLYDITAQRILCIKWLDHVKNVTVSEKTGLNDVPVPLMIADRRHYLFDHACRLSPEALLHQTLQRCIDASSDIRL